MNGTSFIFAGIKSINTKINQVDIDINGKLSANCDNWHKYNNPNPLQRLLIRRFLNAVVSLVKESSALSLADIGCAEGFVSKRLRHLSESYRLTGMDIDFNSLKRAQLINPWLPYQQATIYNIPYKSQSFDLVVCLEVIEHLEYPQQALAELKRIARRYCLFSVPHEPFFRVANFLRGKNIKRLGNDPDHRNHWGRASFIKLLRAAGFVILKVKMPFPWLIVLTEFNHDT